MSSLRAIRIATRSSPLALYQANAVKEQLKTLGYTCHLIPIESTGDLQLTQPIYAMGISGVFTKQLDIALLNNDADIAVHSLKDVPTRLAEGLCLPSVLERGAHEDVALIKQDKDIIESGLSTVATSSLRRRAQWLAKYPHHQTVPIRGNVQTRLRKFAEDGSMDAVIFAKAGLERMHLLPPNALVLDWMLPAPAQGIIGIVCRENDKTTIEACEKINHHPSYTTGFIERQFLQVLMGGCSVPISGLAQITGTEITFNGAMHSFNGQQHYKILHTTDIADWETAGKEVAEKLLQQAGAAQLLADIKSKNLKDESIID